MIKKNLKKRSITSLFLIILLYLIYKFNFTLVFSLLVIGILSIIEFQNILKKIIEKKIKFFMLNLIFIFYIFIFCFVFIYFTNFIQLKILIFSLLLGCVSSDIGGFIFGKIIKGPKLTKISPNKTISGSIGSIILCSIVLTISVYYLSGGYNSKIIIIGIITSLACQLGDLFFSYLKRMARLKDTGNFLPGHGGILDRVDGILFGIPIGIVSVILIF